MGSQRRRLSVPVLHAVARMLLAADGTRPTQLLRALNIANFVARGAADALVAADLAALSASSARDDAAGSAANRKSGGEKGGDGDEKGGGGRGGGGGAALAELALSWDKLRVVMQGACLAWMGHSLPEIALQSATLLATFDSAAALAHLAPRAARGPPLRSYLSSWSRRCPPPLLPSLTCP
jgi:hypothetical protein